MWRLQWIGLPVNSGLVGVVIDSDWGYHINFGETYYSAMCGKLYVSLGWMGCVTLCSKLKGSAVYF